MLHKFFAFSVLFFFISSLSAQPLLKVSAKISVGKKSKNWEKQLFATFIAEKKIAADFGYSENEVVADDNSLYSDNDIAPALNDDTIISSDDDLLGIRGKNSPGTATKKIMPAHRSSSVRQMNPVNHITLDTATYPEPSHLQEEIVDAMEEFVYPDIDEKIAEDEFLQNNKKPDEIAVSPKKKKEQKISSTDQSGKKKHGNREQLPENKTVKHQEKEEEEKNPELEKRKKELLKRHLNKEKIKENRQQKIN